MNPSTHIKQQIDVCIGQSGTTVGSLTYVKQGQRENTAFVYDPSWLASPDSFKISPELELTADFQWRRAASALDSPFSYAVADTAPDAWGRRVIARDHAKRRKTAPTLAALTELDYLLAVDDSSRVGALRLRDRAKNYCRAAEQGQRSTPPLVELQHMYGASRAVESGTETAEDLKYLQGKGTSLGGMRPKCTVIDANGRLAIGKFPSIIDNRSVTRGEVLALRLARLAGIDAAPARVIDVDGVAMAIIERFDRTAVDARIPYLSAASMLQASRQDEHAYTEIADAIRANCAAPTADAQQLWRRMVFNLLITNVDDHLQNHGFLHVGCGQWRLAPAFDLNPFPDKERESKTWLSELDGPVTDVATLLARCGYFALTAAKALRVLSEVYAAVADWKKVALSEVVGMQPKDLDDFASAFEHEQMTAARHFLTTTPG
ncbi:type II toxin-antitoxin system HipA family toxin [Rhodoferax antarcticus]|uniref:type II toxin-antitoxin system HipA family toxin n=1 Tax=Rhodoferax antarcticus TaxID=81479 RepID=UPI002224CD30|nr:type II toxin-antitoxin system HipA family toxin [Rhodoferax antarcticus]MCW2312808.1 serine/threonine-protein kinase HipA [Rhodoferax antarcticus]